MRDEADHIKKFKDVGLKWTGKLAMEVKHSAVKMADAFMVTAMREVDRIQGLKCQAQKRQQMAVKCLEGANLFPPARGILW